MGRYIEFVGVPGVGKSTTYEALKKRYNKQAKWIPYEELIKNNSAYKKGYKESLINFLIKQINPHAVVKLRSNRGILNRFIQENAELVEEFWKNIIKVKECKGEEFRFYGVKYIRSILEKIQNVKENTGDRFCVVDEGLIHNLNYFIFELRKRPENTEIAHILDLIYLPDAVVYFTGDVKTIVERTIQRGNLRLREKNLSPQELFESKIASIEEKDNFIEAVKSRNIPIIELDARESVSGKTEKIVNFINLLSSKKSSVFQREIKI